MRPLLGKDLKVLRRSPAIVAVLIIYPAVIALLLGLALSRAPDKPRVAIYNGLKNGGETLTVGGTKVDPREYAEELFKSIEPLDVDSREEAVSKVKDGEALAAIIVPEDLLTSLQGLVGLNASSTPRIEILYNGSDPLKRDLAESPSRRGSPISTARSRASSRRSRRDTSICCCVAAVSSCSVSRSMWSGSSGPSGQSTG
ncbi:MAG TPA: hypothetical protein PKB03_08290 [Baekduia sp.]|nr:hypothetical protein [Baekduia sp.]